MIAAAVNSEPKGHCEVCGVAILASTAAETGGKCIPCARGTRAQMEKNRRWLVEHRERMRKNDAARERIGRNPNPAFGEFLAEDDPIAVLGRLIVGKVFDNPSKEEHVEVLSAHARSLYFVETLEGEVLNGGFRQFFSNSSGKYAHETLVALREMGALRAAVLLEKAIDAFPDKRVPVRRRARNDALETANPEIFDALDAEYYRLEKSTGENLGKLILDFVKRNASARVTV